jgi:hypothetical protein
MARKVRHAFHDILEAIDRIEEVTRGKPLAEFEASWELRWLSRANLKTQCPRGPVSWYDRRVGKIASSIGAYCTNCGTDFAHPTGLGLRCRLGSEARLR